MTKAIASLAQNMLPHGLAGISHRQGYCTARLTTLPTPACCQQQPWRRPRLTARRHQSKRLRVCCASGAVLVMTRQPPGGGPVKHEHAIGYAVTPWPWVVVRMLVVVMAVAVNLGSCVGSRDWLGWVGGGGCSKDMGLT